jgi:hypothetical protein
MEDVGDEQVLFTYRASLAFGYKAWHIVTGLHLHHGTVRIRLQQCGV